MIDEKWLLDAVERMNNPETYTLKKGQYLSDLHLQYEEGITLLQAGTGVGKSTEGLSQQCEEHTV